MIAKEKQFVSFVICAHNLEDTVGGFLKELYEFAENTFELFECILIDDGSTDGTKEVLTPLRPVVNNTVTVVELAWQHGSEKALAAGTDLAIGDYIFEIDAAVADYTMETVYAVFKRSTEGFDIVTATPAVKTSVFSRAFYSVLRKGSKLHYDLTTERLRLVTRRAYNFVARNQETVSYRKLLYQYSGFLTETVEYMPVRQITARHSFRERLSTGFDILLTFSDIGPKISLVVSLVFLLLSLSIGIYALYFYFVVRTTVEGWTTVMLFLSFGFSSIFLVLGLISEYISIMLKEIKRRPDYVVKTVTRL